MISSLREAIQEITRLSPADQEAIGRQLISLVEKLKHLRTELDKGLRSLDIGEGRPLDLDRFIRSRKTGRGSR